MMEKKPNLSFQTGVKGRVGDVFLKHFFFTILLETFTPRVQPINEMFFVKVNPSIKLPLPPPLRIPLYVYALLYSGGITSGEERNRFGLLNCEF